MVGIPIEYRKLLIKKWKTIVESVYFSGESNLPIVKSRVPMPNVKSHDSTKSEKVLTIELDSEVGYKHDHVFVNSVKYIKEKHDNI